MMDFSPELLLGGIIGGFCLALLYYFFGKERYPYYARETLLTPTELKFYKVLSTICTKDFPALGIAMQVRLADIINCSESDWQKGYGPKISAKHIDFVLFDKQTTQIQLCLELDDRSHERPERKRRDIFINKALHSAGVPLVRISTKNMYNQEFIRRNLHEFIL